MQGDAEGTAGDDDVTVEEVLGEVGSLASVLTWQAQHLAPCSAKATLLAYHLPDLQSSSNPVCCALLLYSHLCDQ